MVPDSSPRRQFFVSVEATRCGLDNCFVSDIRVSGQFFFPSRYFGGGFSLDQGFQGWGGTVAISWPTPALSVFCFLFSAPPQAPAAALCFSPPTSRRRDVTAAFRGRGCVPLDALFLTAPKETRSPYGNSAPLPKTTDLRLCYLGSPCVLPRVSPRVSDVPAVFRAPDAFLSTSSSSRLPLEAAPATQGDSLSVREHSRSS